MATEFEINGVKYRANPMDARRQFHVAMKFVGVIGAIEEMSNPLAALSSMSEENTDYILNSCLATVERQEAGGTTWAPIMAPNGLIMHEDLRTSMAALLQIVVPVIEANVQGFLSALPKGYIAGLAARVTRSSLSA